MFNGLISLKEKIYIIIIDGTLSEVRKLLISDLPVAAGKWRMMRGLSGFHFCRHRSDGYRVVEMSWGEG